jgi:uroporphyrinogen decarboxylase
LIGFAGSPWTLATYMVEGSSSREFATIKAMLYDRPELLHRLLGKVAAAVTDYLNAQIEAGAQVLMIFDTWGGALSAEAYRHFSLAYAQRIVERLRRERDGQRIPVIFFTKGGGQWLETMAQIGCDGIGLDWTSDIGQARARVGHQVALQGNLDPTVLYAPPAVIHHEVNKVLTSFGEGSGHVFNLGHGIHPNMDPDRVAAMIKAVHELSPTFHLRRNTKVGA